MDLRISEVSRHLLLAACVCILNTVAELFLVPRNCKFHRQMRQLSDFNNLELLQSLALADMQAYESLNIGNHKDIIFSTWTVKTNQPGSFQVEIYGKQGGLKLSQVVWTNYELE